MGYALGIDLGGTKILAGLIDTATGAVLSTAMQPTRVEHDQDDVLQRIGAVAEDAIKRGNLSSEDVTAVGIGAAGQVDTERGTLLRAPNLPDTLTRIPLADNLRDLLNRPVMLVNDVQAAAAGEAAFGAGRGCNDFVCILVGTGIGGAVYKDGKPYRGATNTAGEIGHMVVDTGGRLCGCGARGHLEAYASRTGILRSVLGALRLGRRSMLADIEPEPNPDDPARSAIGHREIADAVSAGDPLALEIVDEAACYLAAGIVSVINFYNPARIVLGGGVIGEMPRVFDIVVAAARDQALQVPRRRVEMVRAQMGENPGIVGAAILAAQPEM